MGKVVTLIVNAGADKSGIPYQKLTFSGTASDGTEPYTFTWRFRDSVNGPVLLTKTGQTITHSFSSAKRYYLTLTVKDATDVVASDNLEVNIAQFVVNAGQDQQGIPYKKLSFSGSASGGQTPYSWTWKFRDSPTGPVLLTKTGQSIQHAFSSIKQYYLTLTVKDTLNRYVSDTVKVTITNPVVDEQIITPHETIPNFGSNPTTKTIKSGNWSDATVWSAGIPGTNAKAAVSNGHTIVYDISSNVRIDTVLVQPTGVLSFTDSINTKLMVRNLQVLEGGELRIHNKDNQLITTEIVIIDEPLTDVGRFCNGLIVLGKVDLCGYSKTSWVQFAEEPLKNDTVLKLSAPVDSWIAGDKLVIPDSRQLTYDELAYPALALGWLGDVCTIQSVSADKKTVTITEPLKNNHKGARNGQGTIEILPHVANLSRNVIIRSENENGVRGHCICTHNAMVDICHVEFASLGRTTNKTLDSVSNHKGRYPLHMHHLSMGMSEPRFVIDGCAIYEDLLDNHDNKWGLTIHDSSYGIASNNVIYNWAGACFVFEDGMEEYNIIEKNIAIRTRAPYGTELTETGADYAGVYWMVGVRNYFRDNIACNGQYGIFYYPKAFGGTIEPILECARNMVYSVENGISPWDLGITIIAGPRPTEYSVFKDNVIWHWLYLAYQYYNVEKSIIDGGAAFNDYTVGGGIFMSPGAYAANDFILKNINIQGCALGFQHPPLTNDGASDFQIVVENSYFDCAQVDIVLDNLNTPTAQPHNMHHRRLIVRNVKHGDLKIRQGYPNTKISLPYYLYWANVIQLDQILIENYNESGINYKVWRNEQLREYIMPMSVWIGPDYPSILGCPEEGLTNEQAFAKYGIATGGELPPPTAQLIDGTPLGIPGWLERTN